MTLSEQMENLTEETKKKTENKLTFVIFWQQGEDAELIWKVLI